MWTGSRVSVRNRDPSEWLTRSDTRSRLTRSENPLQGVVQTVVGIRVSVWPSVDRYADDIARGIEATGAQDARKLITDVPFEGFKARTEERGAADSVLFLSR